MTALWRLPGIPINSNTPSPICRSLGRPCRAGIKNAITWSLRKTRSCPSAARRRQSRISVLCFSIPGTSALFPRPAIPIFEIGPFLSGAKIEYYQLKEENDYELDLDSIPEELAYKAKAIIVSYPANPVSASVRPEFYPKLIAWAKKYNVIVIHDNAYSEITFEGFEGTSFLCFEGAKDVGVEFNSLSKAYNLTGSENFLLPWKQQNNFRVQKAPFPDRLRYFPSHTVRCHSGSQQPYGQH